MLDTLDCVRAATDLPGPDQADIRELAPAVPPESQSKVFEARAVKSFLIVGITHDGKPFRPSDWADRLCGIMAQFRPGGGGPGAHLGYSPLVVPDQHGEAKCVRVDAGLYAIERMAYQFLVNFAADNGLQVSELDD